MSDLWIVTSGWQGNGMEGAIVEADTEAGAFDRAAEALTAHAADLGKNPAEWQLKHRDEQIESYRIRERFRAKRITLPYVGEFG